MKEISLVLSGGGARGIAHIGVIKYLEANGYVIQNIAGTSMGAIVGAVYASGKLNEFEKFLMDLDAKTIIKLVDFSITRPGIIEGKKIIHKLKEFLTCEKIEDLQKNYLCIATDINNQKEILWNKGNLLTAIHSSFAIPFIFDPVIENKKILVDGGVVNNIPVNHVDRELLTIAVCANASVDINILPPEIINFKFQNNKNKKSTIKKYLNNLIGKKKDNSMPGYYEILDSTLHIMIEQNSMNILKRYPPDYLIKIPRKIAGTFDFLKAKQLIRAGEYLAKVTMNS